MDHRNYILLNDNKPEYVQQKHTLYSLALWAFSSQPEADVDVRMSAPRALWMDSFLFMSIDVHFGMLMMLSDFREICES